MSFEVPEHVRPLRERVRTFIDQRVIPAEPALEERGEGGRAVMRRLMDEAKAAGLWALGHPKELGGGGLPFMDYVMVNEIVGRVRGRVCLLVDDMIDTGGTILKAAEALKANGAERVIVTATHAVFSDPATDRLQDEAIDEVVVTDTIPLPPGKLFDGLTVLPIAPLLARAIHEVFVDGSVTSMFDGAA